MITINPNAKDLSVVISTNDLKNDVIEFEGLIDLAIKCGGETNIDRTLINPLYFGWSSFNVSLDYISKNFLEKLLPKEVLE